MKALELLSFTHELSIYQNVNKEGNNLIDYNLPFVLHFLAETTAGVCEAGTVQEVLDL